MLLSACSVDPPKRTVSHGRGAATQLTPATRADGASYTVARGDTLYSIAFRNQLDYHDLADWNDIGRDYTIRVGQVLRLTPPGQAALPAELPEPASPAASRATSKVQPPTAPFVAASSRAATSAAAVPVPNAAQTAPAAPLVRRLDDGGWEWPTRGKVVRNFGDDASAKGIDITGDRGQIVVASRAGKVVYSGTALKGYGELIIIKHDEQYLSAYGYNRRRLVEEGDTVAAGQPIAEMGDGPEQRPLLHYEIREKGRPVDPRPLLPAR